MTDTKFTKGEWLVSDKKINSPVRHIVKMPSSKPTKYNGTMYSCIGGFDSETQSEEAEANAHLIASAPAMYEMLERVSKLMGLEGDYAIEWLLDNTDNLIDLLSKARGE